LRPGAWADLTMIDPDAEWTIDPRGFSSRSRNTPFGGMRVRGRVEATIVGGHVRYRRAESAAPA
jgi:dihydroorotase